MRFVIPTRRRRLRRAACLGGAGLVAALLCAAPALAAQPEHERSGKAIVDSLCISCHGTGAGGAPKIGDRKAWSARSAKGLTGLSQNALKGIRQMPPHGGNPELTDTEIERAITYMVNRSGGHWIEPVSRREAPRTRSAQEIVDTQCARCHASGVGGAPKIGERAAWMPRLQAGLDALVRSAINGHGGMPPRGGKADLTDAELRSAVVYMFNKGTGAPL